MTFPTNHAKPWTMSADTCLLDHAHAGADPRDLPGILGRTAESLRCRLLLLRNETPSVAVGDFSTLLSALQWWASRSDNAFDSLKLRALAAIYGTAAAEPKTSDAELMDENLLRAIRRGDAPRSIHTAFGGNWDAITTRVQALCDAEADICQRDKPPRFINYVHALRYVRGQRSGFSRRATRAKWHPPIKLRDVRLSFTSMFPKENASWYRAFLRIRDEFIGNTAVAKDEPADILVYKGKSLFFGDYADAEKRILAADWRTHDDHAWFYGTSHYTPDAMRIKPDGTAEIVEFKTGRAPRPYGGLYYTRNPWWNTIRDDLKFYSPKPQEGMSMKSKFYCVYSEANGRLLPGVDTNQMRMEKAEAEKTAKARVSHDFTDQCSVLEAKTTFAVGPVGGTTLKQAKKVKVRAAAK